MFFGFSRNNIYRFSTFLSVVKQEIFSDVEQVNFFKTTPMYLGVTVLDSLSALAISPAVFLADMRQDEKDKLLSIVISLYIIEDDLNCKGIMRSLKKNTQRLENSIRKHDLTDMVEFTLKIKDDLLLDALTWLTINRADLVNPFTSEKTVI